MRTRPANPPTDRLQAFKDALRRPHTWRITGIDAFWLEDRAGNRRTAEFPDTGPAYDAILAVIRSGAHPDDVVLVGRRPEGGRSVISSGEVLLDIAEAHAGIPARPRVPRE